MFYVGIDVHDEQHQVCVMDGQGHPVWEGAVATTPRGLAGLVRRLQHYGASELRIGLESSGPFWVRLMNRLCEAGFTACLVNGNHVKRWAQSGALSTRTDRVDAKIIADYVRVRQPRPYRPAPEVHRRLLDVLKAHDRLTRQKSQWGNRLKADLKRAAAEELVRLDRRQLEITKQALKESEGQIRALLKQIPESQALQEVPGVGMMNAAWFVAKVPFPEDFPTKGHVKAHFGLAPKEHYSAGRKRSSHLSRQGSAAARAVLHMGAWSAVRAYPEIRARHDLQIANGKTEARATVHVMAYLAGQMWKASKRYRREHRPVPVEVIQEAKEERKS